MNFALLLMYIVSIEWVLSEHIAMEYNPIYRKDIRVYEEPPTSCAEAFNREKSPQNGIYVLHLPLSNSKPFPVYCLSDPNGGVAWTIVQRRVDNTTDMPMTWSEYVHGFGNLNQNFFIGLQKLHSLTSHHITQELWIQWTEAPPSGKSTYALYDSFAIGDVATEYNIQVLGEYNGTAGNLLQQYRGDTFFKRNMDGCGIKNFKDSIQATWFKDCQFLSAIMNWHKTNMSYIHMALRPSGW